MTKLNLKLLGGFELHDPDAGEIAVRSRKLCGLIAYIALDPDRRHARETLAGLFWGDRFEAQARQSLRQALTAFRKLLGDRADDVIDSDDTTMTLNGAALSVDVAEFERLAGAGQYEEAAALYGGDFIKGLDARSEAFDLWAGDQRARLREVACGVWENLFERRLQDSDVDVAIEAGTRLVALDPLREQSQRRLLQAYAQAGRRAEALQHFQNFSARLRSELDVEPDQETLRLVADIRTAPARPADRTSDPSIAVPDAHAATRRRRWLLPAGVIGAALAGFVLWAVLFDGGIFAPNRSTVQELTVPARDRPSIAVLPFDNLSGDSAQEYFADGITEDITAGLAKFGHVLVVSRNSAFSYKGVSVNVTDVARDLRVQYVLEGSVRRAGDQVRITVQLIDAVADKHVWAEKYDRTFQDVFAIQDEITQNIVAAVAPEYLSAEMRRSQQAPPRNLSAWDSFMRGYWHLLRFTRNDNTTAQRHLREAIALDPHKSHYYGLLSVTYTMDGLYGWSGVRARAFDMALKHAERGLALDGQDSLSIRAAGLVHFFSKNHDVALDYYRRAVDANPDEAENRALLGAALGVAGDYDGAVEQFQTAFALSPRDVHVATWYNYLAVAAFVAGRDAAALGWAKKTVQANPKFPGGHRTFAASYGVLGRLEEAKTAGEALLQLMPHLTLAQMRESLPYFKEPQDLERYLDGLRASGVPD